MKATDCKCCVCGKQAVAFWPIIDPDIPDHPYCRKCLDEAKAEALANILGLPPKAAKGLTKIFKKNRDETNN